MYTNRSHRDNHGNTYDNFLEDLYRYSNNRRNYGPWRSMRSFPWYYDDAFERRRDRRNVTRDEEVEEEEEETEVPVRVPVPEVTNTQLRVERLALNVGKNALKHKTDKFECTMKARNPILVVRRGQPFRISIYFDKPYIIAQHQLDFRFFIGKEPTPAKRTEARLAMAENVSARRTDPTKWFVKMVENVKESKSVLLEITPPSNCIIGQWMFDVETASKIRRDTLKFIYDNDEDFFVLFNPYNPEDQVYMPDTDLLKEYIDCEAGVIFVGSTGQIGGRPWNFGQFYGDDGLVLKVCMHILRKAFKGEIDIGMSDPIEVSRAVSQMVNENDGDRGILKGKWSGNYDDGEKPWYWTGSSDILQRYHDTKAPVRYGQCWVFSGLTTTVCRALGIPCRSVTNFASAHDTDASATHDRYYTYNAKESKLEEYDAWNKDSIWNFHVWNECWMKRPDIKEGDCDGWQVVDATPQERSQGLFQCGPCPVSAIKRGDIAKPYDANFIFGEVNCDDIMWINDEQMGEIYVNEVDSNRVGQNISTKFPDGEPYYENDAYWLAEKFREDITHTYKYSEGSDEERMAVKRAMKIANAGDKRHKLFANAGRNRDVHFTGQEKRDVVIHIEAKDKFMAGQDFNFTVRIENKSRKSRVVRHLLIAVDSTSYTGAKVHNIIKQKLDYFELDPLKEKEININVRKDDYMDKMAEYFGMEIKVSALAIRKTDNGGNYSDLIRKRRPFRLRRPGIQIKADQYVRVGVPFKAQLTFNNTMPKPLTNCSMHIAGNGIKDITIKEENVPPNSRFSKQYELIATKPGRINIIASFTCRNLADITGSITVKANR